MHAVNYLHSYAPHWSITGAKSQVIKGLDDSNTKLRLMTFIYSSLILGKLAHLWFCSSENHQKYHFSSEFQAYIIWKPRQIPGYPGGTFIMPLCANCPKNCSIHEFIPFSHVILLQFTEAVDLCLENNVKLNESLVERLTPEKDQTPSSGTREQLLMKLGDCCMKQGAYHLACKKYTQAGDRERVLLDFYLSRV